MRKRIRPCGDSCRETGHARTIRVYKTLPGVLTAYMNEDEPTEEIRRGFNALRDTLYHGIMAPLDPPVSEPHALVDRRAAADIIGCAVSCITNLHKHGVFRMTYGDGLQYFSREGAEALACAR